ncbi:MAG: DUF86 domain-containing protein [Planctomycetes bacterium]|nr:DUF86 domain-containing protein [Planctomycetota bacterium]
MQRDDNVYLGHMLDMARKAAGKIEGKSRDDYDSDEDLRIVIAHLVQTIGEAAGRVSQPTRDSHPELPWKQITGIGHRIVHDYMGVDYDVLWEVARQELPRLIGLLDKIMPPEDTQ